MQDDREALQENIKRLHNLCRCIDEVLSTIIHATHLQANLGPSLAEGQNKNPDIRLVEQMLWIDQVMIPLTTRPKTLELVQAFFQSPDLSLSKEELVSLIYGDKDAKSERYLHSQHVSLTKLLSRTRSYLETSLNPNYQKLKIEWLVYENKNRKYQLYAFKSWNLRLQGLDESEAGLVSQ